MSHQHRQYHYLLTCTNDHRVQPAQWNIEPVITGTMEHRAGCGGSWVTLMHASPDAPGSGGQRSRPESFSGWLGSGGQRSRPAIFSRWAGSQWTENVVRTVCFQRWISSAILAQGPTRATSSTSLVGTAAMALFLSPAR